jgi:hypothetical protein
MGKRVAAFLPKKTNVSQESGVKQARKNTGLKVVTLIATLNPVSQVLW